MSVIPCDSPHLCAVNITTSDGPIVVMCVSVPCDNKDNFPIFTDCLSAVSAIIHECAELSVYILGDFNAHPNELFYNKLTDFCSIANCGYVDTLQNQLGSSVDIYTFLCQATGL